MLIRSVHSVVYCISLLRDNSLKYTKLSKSSDTVLTKELNHGTKLAENIPVTTSVPPPHE